MPIPSITGPIPAASRESIGTRPKTRVARQIPIQSGWIDWSVTSLREAIESHELGMFNQSAALVDWLGRDDRVDATLGTRVRAVQGLPFRLDPSEESERPDLARALAEEGKKLWPRIAPRSLQAEILRWTALMGFAVAQILWDTSGGRWVPTLEWWHPQHLSWRWDLGRLQAITLDGVEIITPGDGQWVVFAPHGLYRGWMRGGVRSLAILALLRQYALRDWGRASEMYGMGVRLGYLPPNCDPDDEDRFLSQLVNLGAESVLLLQKGDDEAASFDFDIKALAGTFNGELFERLGQRCDLGITLQLLGQNLTSEVQEGSLAAARVHGDVRQDYLEADVAGQQADWREQVLRPWAAYNYGAAPEDVPVPVWDVEPPEDKDSASKTLMQVSQALTALAQLPGLGPSVDLVQLAERFDLPLLPGAKPDLTPPATPIPGPSPALGLAALAQGSPPDPAARWVEQLAEGAAAEGASALRPLLDAVLDAVRGASSLDDAQRRLQALAADASPEAFAAVLQRALLSAHLAGRVAVREAPGGA
jgi:phage gp29-like protein